MVSGMEPEERDRLTRVETKLDSLISSFTKLSLLEEKVEKHQTFIDKANERIVWVGVAFAIAGNIALFGLNWIISHLKIIMDPT